MPILVNEAFTNIRKTDRAEEWEIHSSFCELVVIKSKTSKFLTKTKKGNVVWRFFEVFMDKKLAHPDLPPGKKTVLSWYLHQSVTSTRSSTKSWTTSSTRYSIRLQQGVSTRVYEFWTSRPNDWTPCAHGSDKNIYTPMQILTLLWNKTATCVALWPSSCHGGQAWLRRRWQAAPPCCHRRTGSEQLSGQICFQSGGWEGVEVGDVTGSMKWLFIWVTIKWKGIWPKNLDMTQSQMLYRVFFSTGPTPKSSKYGTGPTQ